MTVAQEPSTSEQETPAPRRRTRLAMARELVAVVIGALVISALIRAFLGQMFIVPSGSMENTLLVNDRIVASKVNDVHRGDVVVFADPGGWDDQPIKRRGPVGSVLEFVGLLPSTSTNHLVKRVIGMPGDHVTCCSTQGRLSVNGVELDESSYVNSLSGRASDFDFDVTVPAGHLFMLGDHRDKSYDSRCHLDDPVPAGQPSGIVGFVPLDKVVGPVVAIAAPLARMRTLSAPDLFKRVPAAGTPPAVPKWSAQPNC